MTILGKDFTIKVDSLKEAHGECDGPEYEIALHSELKPEQIDTTLFHEAIHAALYVSGLSSVIDDDKLEEAIVVCMENAFIKAIDIDKLTVDK